MTTVPETRSASSSGATMIDSQMRRRGWFALTQVLVLIGLAMFIIRGELPHIYIEFFADPDAAHTWVMPILIGLLMFRWRDALLRSLRCGSPWGILLIVFGLAMFVVTSWPLNYGFVRRVSIIPMITGAVLAVCGWRVFWLSVPLFILTILAIPTGSRYYAAVIIGPETFTLKYATYALNLWPGVFVDANGPDLHYISDASSGAIALGESNRGVSMILPMLAIGVFVIFGSLRAIWKYALCLVALVPIVLFCNFIRFLVLGSVIIMTDAEPISGVPRAAAAASSLLFAYGVFSLMAWLLGGSDPNTGRSSTTEVTA